MSEENTEVQPLFELNDAEVVRAGRTILHVDKFLLAKGENIALLGPNGAGKSTFVKLITREVMPLYREQPPVKFNGNPRATLVDVRKTLGIVSSTMQAQINVHLPAVDIVEGGLFGTLGLPRHVHPDERTHAKALGEACRSGHHDHVERSGTPRALRSRPRARSEHVVA